MKQNKDISKLHNDKLGMQVPDGFFEKSKADILESGKTQKEEKQKVFWLKPIYTYPIAAALVVALAITFWLNNDDSTTNNTITDTDEMNVISLDDLENDFLVSSLMVEDSDMDEFLNDYIVDEILVEVDKKEQEIDDLIINSLFIEDSLIDGYLDENLIENVFL